MTSLSTQKAGTPDHAFVCCTVELMPDYPSGCVHALGLNKCHAANCRAPREHHAR